jgi:hypothetical protein
MAMIGTYLEGGIDWEAGVLERYAEINLSEQVHDEHTKAFHVHTAMKKYFGLIQDAGNNVYIQRRFLCK